MKKTSILIILISFSWLNTASAEYTKSLPAGTALENPATNWSATDDDSLQVNIGFDFPFGSVALSNQVTINSNGGLTLENNWSTYNNQALPSNDKPTIIAPYWDDMNRASGGTIRYGTFGSAGNKRFVVAWNNVPHYGNSNLYTFQVVLYENGDIRYRYDNNCTSCTGGGNNGATIGVQESNSEYNQHLYNQNNLDRTKDVLYTRVPPPVDYGYSDYHFDEVNYNGTANEVVDSHAGFHGSSNSNTPLIAGKVCNAIDLRASSTQDLATLGAASLDGVQDFTISVWHKGNSNNIHSLLSGAKNGSDNELIFWFSNATTFNGHLKSLGNLGTVSTSNFNNNSWHHLTWRRSTGQSCLFIDGTSQGCQAQTNTGILNITSLILGQEQDSVGGGYDANQDWEGILDELMIFRRALTTTEINNIYNNQNAGKNWDGSYRACPNMPAMKLTKTSQVISDPVNNTNNPKRIPGAIVRYTIHAENAHGTAGENVIITDSLDTFISSGKINWAGNIVINSPNTNGGAATALTDAVDGDVGQFNTNTLTVQCGNISNSTPCIVSYDIEISQ